MLDSKLSTRRTLDKSLCDHHLPCLCAFTFLSDLLHYRYPSLLFYSLEHQSQPSGNVAHSRTTTVSFSLSLVQYLYSIVRLSLHLIQA